jgi:hypothetical protein
MSAGVTLGTERDEIQLGIFARMAAKFLGEPPSPTSCRTIDTARRPDAAAAALDSRTTPDSAARARALDQSSS